MELGFAFWGSKTLLSAVEVGLFSELANGSERGRFKEGDHRRVRSD